MKENPALQSLKRASAGLALFGIAALVVYHLSLSSFTLESGLTALLVVQWLPWVGFGAIAFSVLGVLLSLHAAAVTWYPERSGTE